MFEKVGTASVAPHEKINIILAPTDVRLVRPQPTTQKPDDSRWAVLANAFRMVC